MRQYDSLENDILDLNHDSNFKLSIEDAIRNTSRAAGSAPPVHSTQFIGTLPVELAPITSGCYRSYVELPMTDIYW